ncbi:MAG: hypothetical protein KJO56_00280 [Gammaproteobacteria bacterium]|nr:hypothetical protein [Gammaproteobacteria bacterium]MBT8104646.1 hypothetical protein [Gammaproteobacteria bacterium]NNK24660.1 hypothetical protein [Woeseiaceae bacterium]
MIGNNGENEDTEFDEAVEQEEVLDEDAMPDIGVETIVDLTGELKVDKLVAKVEKSDPDEAAHKREIRKRLEELEEQRNAKLDDTFNIKIEDEF